MRFILNIYALPMITMVTPRSTRREPPTILKVTLSIFCKNKCVNAIAISGFIAPIGDAMVTGALDRAVNMKNTPNDEKIPAKAIIKKADLGALVSVLRFLMDIIKRKSTPKNIVQVALTAGDATPVTTERAIV